MENNVIKTTIFKCIPKEIKMMTTINGENIIIPHNKNKFLGSLYEYNNRYRVKIEISDKSYYIDEAIRIFKSFDNIEDANNFMEKKCSELGLFKNKMIDCGNHIKMQLPKNKFTLVDKDDFYLVDKHIWHCQQSYNSDNHPYVRNTDGIALHNFVMNFVPNDKMTIDHINNDTLDNRRSNLRISNKTIQAINKKINSSNKSGITGVYHQKKGNRESWNSKWTDDKCKVHHKSFSCNLYGHEEAFLKARKSREEGIKNVKNYVDSLML